MSAEQKPTFLADVACGSRGRSICEWVYGRTGSAEAAEILGVLLSMIARSALIVLGAFLVHRLLQRIVIRRGQRMASKGARYVNGSDRSKVEEERAHLRVETMATVLSSLTRFIIACVVIVLLLGQFGVSLAPFFAGAGVLGVALGFGAQKIVADFLAGFFMLAEDQFGVGDVIDVGDVSGVVEAMTLRMVSVRDVHGSIWFVSNSEIRRVANKSQLWARAVLDIDVAYDTDLRRAEGIIQRVADELWQDGEFDEADIIEAPEVWGVERLGADGVTIRLVVKTDPAEQWMVARELRLRIKSALEEAGIEMPFPQRTVWLRSDTANVPSSDRPTVETAVPRHGEPGDHHGG